MSLSVLVPCCRAGPGEVAGKCHLSRFRSYTCIIQREGFSSRLTRFGHLEQVKGVTGALSGGDTVLYGDGVLCRGGSAVVDLRADV